MRVTGIKTPLFAALLAMTSPAALADSLSAAMSWNGHGQLFQVGVNHQEFLGAIDGIMYFETASGALDEAFVECTAKQSLHRGERKTRAHGNCLIVQSGDDTAYAEYQCDGEIGACKGTFTLTGGVGRLAGISGKGKMILRSPLRQVTPDTSSSESITIRNGVLLLPDLQYTIPGGRKK